ncbi:glutathione synthase [Tothia fuscella]|uniref:Glutathione synthetase n=1 Tax=Tothia fuscella TaxID=1048955 RepID=A0A9P4NYJ0_9PEZI|nr:glutathione synthase [Tothia fuscella]
MAQPIYPEYPPELSQARRQYLLTNLKDWSIAHGLAVRPAPAFVPSEQDPEFALATTAPVTLFPSLFPKSCFEEGLSIQTTYNKLYSAIASDEEWLKPIIEELLDIDSFVEDLWKVHLAVAKDGYVQDLTLGLFRSDYMVHIDSSSSPAVGIKQVEFNTIASSFGGLSSKVSALHQHLESIDAYPSHKDPLIPKGSGVQSSSVPLLATGLAAAHMAYGNSKESRPLCVLFIVQDPERNVFDQRHLEYELSSSHKVRVFRLPFRQILTDTKLDTDRTLLYHAPHDPDTSFEVTTVYFRAGYSPDEYNGEEDWSARLHMERSRAIKCPSVLTQLAGCKKIQQVLATPLSPHLTRFLPNRSEAERIEKTFAPIYPMDLSEAGREARKLASDSESASHYVLKPQREGGGNNIYRKAIPEFLRNTPESHWPAHILMEMIEPPAQKNIIFRNGELQKGGVICELGIYGVCLWKNSKPGGKSEILENWEAGYLLRTKGDQSEEGGVAAGFGAVDSCYLIDI